MLPQNLERFDSNFARLAQHEGIAHELTRLARYISEARAIYDQRQELDRKLYEAEARIAEIISREEFCSFWKALGEWYLSRDLAGEVERLAEELKAS